MPGYRVKHESICIAGAADLRVRSLLDRVQFADPDGDALRQGISSASWPLFGLLWPSGLKLAAWMAERPLSRHERILEIGCGLALASLVAHRRGADITASDCHPLAGAFLEQNLLLNGLPPMRYRHGRWSAGAPGPAPAPWLALYGRFDLIVGSDLLYERDDGGVLAGFIDRHAAPGASVAIVDPDRGNRTAFTRRMTALGFVARETPMRSPAAHATQAYRGRLLSYRRPPGARPHPMEH